MLSCACFTGRENKLSDLIDQEGVNVYTYRFDFNAASSVCVLGKMRFARQTNNYFIASRRWNFYNLCAEFSYDFSYAGKACVMVYRCSRSMPLPTFFEVSFPCFATIFNSARWRMAVFPNREENTLLSNSFLAQSVLYSITGISIRDPAPYSVFSAKAHHH